MDIVDEVVQVCPRSAPLHSPGSLSCLFSRSGVGPGGAREDRQRRQCGRVRDASCRCARRVVRRRGRCTRGETRARTL
eukprot:1968476-Rhodomonas_salina.6